MLIFSNFLEYSWIKSTFQPLTADLTGRAVPGKVLMHIKSFVLKFYTFWYRSPDWGRLEKGVIHGKPNKIIQILTHFLRRLDQNHVNHTFWCAQNDPHLVCMCMEGFESMTPTHIDATHANIFRNTNFIFRNPTEFNQNFSAKKTAMVDYPRN